MSLVLTLDPDDPTPPYEQLRRQLGDLIAAGRLGPGDRLPPLRQLAGDEQEGLLTSRRGGGTRVAESGRAPAVNRQEMLEGMAADFVARVRGLGYTDDETVVALERQLRF